MTILNNILASKQTEIAALHQQYQMGKLAMACGVSAPEEPEFYRRLTMAKASGQPFFIAEFKRKSPSEGWINPDADLSEQISAYARAGASAISVLTDGPFFGGSYADLSTARKTLDTLPHPPLLLQKEFILDPIQIYLAKLAGADLILLIAAILEPGQLESLLQLAESIGLGVLVEVHDEAELSAIEHLPFPVLGVNNRDLKTFRTSLNRVNTLMPKAGGRFVIAESGILDARHLQMVQRADGFLIGTGLMRNGSDLPETFSAHFQSEGKMLFKACGIRTTDLFRKLNSSSDTDWLGINFSPASKRRVSLEGFANMLPGHFNRLVAVFYQNEPEEIKEVLTRFPFKTIQLYAGDVSPEFVRSLKVRVLMAIKTPVGESPSAILSNLAMPYAADVDCFILDGARPGAGQRLSGYLPEHFPYPFLLAGGLNEDNLEVAVQYANCIGVDIASGIETEGEPDFKKIRRITVRLAALPLPHDLSNSI